MVNLEVNNPDRVLRTDGQEPGMDRTVLLEVTVIQVPMNSMDQPEVIISHKAEHQMARDSRMVADDRMDRMLRQVTMVTYINEAIS